jgi:hypothetical protein
LDQIIGELGDGRFYDLDDLDFLFNPGDREQDGQQPNENGAAELIDFLAMLGDK